MRILVLVVLLAVVTGCAGYAREMAYARTLDDVNVRGKDGACVRSCLATHATCSGRAAMADGMGQQQEVLFACKSNYVACARTC